MKAVGLNYDGRPILVSRDGRTFYTIGKDGALRREPELSQEVVTEAIKKLGPRPRLGSSQ